MLLCRWARSSTGTDGGSQVFHIATCILEQFGDPIDFPHGVPQFLSSKPEPIVECHDMPIGEHFLEDEAPVVHRCSQAVV